jgi:hypothetical protein
MVRVRIDCYLSPECQVEDPLRTNVLKALEGRGFDAEVNFFRVDDQTATNLKLKGSPSVFVNGIELQPIDSGGFS